MLGRREGKGLLFRTDEADGTLYHVHGQLGHWDIGVWEFGEELFSFKKKSVLSRCSVC